MRRDADGDQRMSSCRLHSIHPETEFDLLHRLSPIHKIDRVQAPTIVLHGANDTNVPVVEAEQVVESLAARGVPVKYVLFPDEGHGFVKTSNRIRSTVEIVTWFVETSGKVSPELWPVLCWHAVGTGGGEMSAIPSGEQIEIRHGDLRATVVEVSGGLRTFHAGDAEVLDGYPEDEMCHDARGQLLMPWPNRLAGGSYTFDGHEEQVPINEPSHNNAIHGLVRWRTWTAGDRAADTVTMNLRLYPQPGYPFTLDLAAEYRLDQEGLRVTLRAQNAGKNPAPFGAGQHPYLRAGTALVNEATLRVPARTIHRYNDQLVPDGRVPVEGTPLDFRSPRRIGDTEINMDYTDLERDADGMARVSITPTDGPSLEVWMDQAFHHVTVYTGETVQPPSRRRQSLAVEPMTCPPNAFVSGDDLITLEPGQSWQGVWGITIRQ